MEEATKHKTHRERNAGRKADKKKAKKEHVQELTDKQKNPKAFTFNSAVRAERRFRRKQDIETKRQHIPLVDRTPLEPPPVLVAVVGPPKVGKSLLIQCLIKSFVKHPLTNILGPVTVVSGKKRRITFMECNNDLNSMIDIAKVADLVLLLVDASFGFEMEIFEFLNICQVHGMPRVMGVLTHLDLFKNAKQLRKTKKTLKQRFWTEVYAGAKLFYLSGLLHDEYLRMEVKNLARFISVMKFRPLTWRTAHPYFLADRIEDLTSPEAIRQNSKVDRTISVYGYVRGVPLTKENSVHIPGCGDLKIKDISFLPDPCPLPEQLKKRALVEKERLIYAPFSGVGGIVYDKDAVYVELGGSHSYKEVDTGLVGLLRDTQETLDNKLQQSELQLFTDAKPIKSHDVDGDLQIFSEAKESDEDVTSENLENSEVNDADGEQASKRKRDDGEPERAPTRKKVKDEFEEEMENLRAQSGEAEPCRYVEESVFDNGRIRRKVVFSDSQAINDSEAEGEDRSSDESDEEESPKDTEGLEARKSIDNPIKNKIQEALSSLKDTTPQSNDELDSGESYDELSEDDIPRENASSKIEEVSESEGQSESEEDDGEGQLNWKTNLAEKAREAFASRRNTVNLMKLVYGVFDKQYLEEKEEEENASGTEEGDIGGMFRVMKAQQSQKLKDRELQNQDESVYYSHDSPRDWLGEDNKPLVVNRFVTGKWKESEDAEELLKLDDLDDDEELYGDFEDLETGEKHKAEEKVPVELPKDEADERKKLLDKKKKLKEQFDLEYDNDDGKTYYDELKQEAERQAKLNRSEFEGVDDSVRVQMEGFRPGMYVRVEFESVPCELVENLDPTYPIVVGGLLHGEENIGFVQMRIKKHRWYSKILKTRDPVILSVGWRRFQTLPIFSKLEDNLRHRMLKYTPEHVSCMAHTFGPITPQGTGVLAIQDVATRQPGFRIAATGTIVEIDKTTQVVKKLKLTGVPLKIYKKTAFVKDMFNSALEVAKFEGAKVKTVSGIRGQIKKAVSRPEGCFRATFEDKIRLSDIVFCRTWYKVDVPKFYNPVTSLLLPKESKTQWQGMKTTGQLKRENNIHAVPSKDSLYRPVVRNERVFKPLMIPRSLQRELPYKYKPKIYDRAHKKKETMIDKKLAVVREPHEEKVAKMMKMLKSTYQHKQQQTRVETKKRIAEHKKQLSAVEARKLKRQKELKKIVFKQLSQLDGKKSK